MFRSTFLVGCFAAALFLLPAVGSGQTVAMVSGNGQLVCVVCPGFVTQTFAPLVVSVNDSSGNPLAGTTVTWTSTPGLGAPSQSGPSTATTLTDDTGQASYTFPLVLPTPPFSFVQTSVTAKVATSTVQFIETTTVPGPNSPGAPVFISLLSPQPGQPLSGTAGQTSSIPVQVQVFVINSGVAGGLPGVAVQIISGATGATLSCMSLPGQQPGTVLTDVNGMATCTPVFGGTVGSGTYQVIIGGIYNTFLPGSLTVKAGPPAVIKLISGNAQSVNPGNLYPMPLVAEVDDLGGNASSGAKVIWDVPLGSATLSGTVNTSASNGQVSTRVTAGGAGGPVQVRVRLASNTSVQYIFTLNVNIIFNQLQIISGTGNPPVMVNTAFPDPLIVQVNNMAGSQIQPVAGVTVNFAVTAGSAALSADSAVTDAQGQAQVMATAGDTPGPVTVTASVPGSQLAAAFNLTVLHVGPVISSFANSAGFQNGFISPCSLATIYGTGLATGIQGAVTALIEPPLQMAGVTVTFAGVAAPILSVVNQSGVESVTVQVPCEVVPGTVPAVVAVNGGSTTTSVNVMSFSPGIFQTVMSDGKARAVMVRPDGSFVQLENPARANDIIRVYVTGLGQTTPTLKTNEFVPLIPDQFGNLVPQDLDVNAPLVVGVNNSGVRVVSAKYAYGLIGVYEVQFEVPSHAAKGNDIRFAIAVIQPDGTALFGNPITMPIQ